tara:strand:+ start:4188 stop:4730 length:543 start_codon:yes stop_codon:yes gene_type:complete
MNRESGAVLFLALLMTLMLTGLLVLEVEKTTVEIAMVGNERFAKTAYAVAEGGLVATTAKASQDPQGFLSFAALHNYVVKDDDLNFSVYDLSASGSFGREGANVSVVEFETAMTHPFVTNRIPGYSLQGLCFRRYVWTTTSKYGLGEEEGPETTSVEHTQRLSVQRARSMVYLGPVPCNL